MSIRRKESGSKLNLHLLLLLQATDLLISDLYNILQGLNLCIQIQVFINHGFHIFFHLLLFLLQLLYNPEIQKQYFSEFHILHSQ